MVVGHASLVRVTSETSLFETIPLSKFSVEPTHGIACEGDCFSLAVFLFFFSLDTPSKIH
jgi:hypothetical protein